MITFEKDNNGVIKILQGERRLYTVAEKTYKCISKMGLGYSHIVEMIESLHKITIPHEDREEIKSFFSEIDEETKTFIKKKAI
jgi:hypothetical protein